MIQCVTVLRTIIKAGCTPALQFRSLFYLLWDQVTFEGESRTEFGASKRTRSNIVLLCLLLPDNRAW